ncbi:MAG: EAL domain-containing protein [Burkholderiaceae bacterium]|nr:EAL domain-containing protein [Burkholderiaceae bacterium]
MTSVHPHGSPPAPPANEAQRLAALESHAILDTPTEEAFDQLAYLAAHVCGMPMAVVNFVDRQRQWFKATVGLSIRETDRAVAFCAHWIDGQRDVVEVPDSHQDPRFQSSPLVLGPPHIRFYACAPLVTPDGLALGTLVVMDTRPRSLTQAQRNALHMLASQTMAQLQLRQQHQALRLSEERFYRVARATTDTIWDWDLRTGQLWWSDAARALLGLGEHQPLPQPDGWAEHIAPHDRPRVVQSLHATIDGPECPWSAEYRLQRSDGTCIWVLDQGFVIRDAQGQALRMVGGIKDISAEKQAQLNAQQEAKAQAELVRVQQEMSARLRASEQQYRLLFDVHPQPMWVYAQDNSLRILAVNKAMVALYGYTEAELLTMSMSDLWLPELRERFRGEVMALPIGGGCDALRHNHLHKNGTELDVEIWSRSVEFNGRMARQIMATDITHRLRAERELVRLSRAQQLLSACNEAVVRATTESVLLQDICRIAVEIGGYRLGWVGMAHNDAAKTIEPVAYAGANVGYLQTLDLSWSDTDPRGQGPAGITVRTGQPVIVQDVHREPAYIGLSERMLAHGFHGVISLPLRQGPQTFGLLYLYAPEVLHISPDEARLLQDLANDLAFGITSLRMRKEQQRMQASVLKVAAAVSTTTGTEFFIQLATQMADVLDAQAGCVMRLLPQQHGQPARAAALAMVVQGKLLPTAEYPLEGTPSMTLLTQRQHIVRHSAVQLYPHSPVTAGITQSQAYVGQQLSDSSGDPIGMIFVLFSQPLHDSDADFVSSTLQIFAARASAEIERQVSDTRIRQQASLLDKAQDAIVVHDLQHRITYWNKSAERVYGWPQWQVLGHSIVTLLYQDETLFHRASQAVLSQGEWTGEVVQHHRDGHAIDIEGRWTLVRDDDGLPESILAIHTDIRQRKATEREIQRLAFYDALTGLPNRMLLMDRMHQALAAAHRNHQGGALLFIDLDNFKTLNDTLGHDQGDLLLQQVAQRLNTCVRAIDTVARLGGDEFVVMLEALSPDPSTLAILARGVGEKVLATLAVPYALAGYQYRSTPSIGIAPFDGSSTSVGDLLKQADLAMYQSKTAGRNTLRFFDPQMQAVVTARAALETDLRTALAHNQFLLYYQPQVNHQGRYTGVEALVRWQHPERGLVSPAEFIPVAEETGLILALGRWVLHTACQLLALWQASPELQHLTMAVNVSSRQFRHDGFVEEMAEILESTGAPAHLLKLELTESLLVEDMDTTIDIMTALGALGVGFSLDDFGTGYSSLSYLKRMPLHQLKIDQSFVRDLLTDPNDAAIVNTIIGLSHSLGLNVIAEGVETIEQRDALYQAGCPAFQGYLFSRPLPEAPLQALLRLPVV